MNLDKGSSCTISALQNHFFKALEKMFRILLLKKQDHPWTGSCCGWWVHGIYFTIPVTLCAFEMLRKKEGGGVKNKKGDRFLFWQVLTAVFFSRFISEHGHFSFLMQRECSQVRVPCIKGQASIFNWMSQWDEDSLLERRLDPLIVQVPYKPKGWVN